MNVEELRVGNIVNFETIYFKVDTVTASGKLVVTAIKKECKPEPAVITELKGIASITILNMTIWAMSVPQMFMVPV